MFTCMRYGRWLSGIAAMAMMASPLIAAETASRLAKAERVVDVTISKQGALIGQVLSAAGQPLEKAEIVAIAHKQIVAQTQTDDRGVFQLPVGTAGVYQLVVGKQQLTVRLWQAELAPPATHDSLLCVTQEATVRGQGASRLKCWLTNPCVIGLGIATAVVIPLVVDEIDDDDELPSAS